MKTIRIDDLFDQVAATTIEARRLFIARHFYANFDGIVRYGPLKGTLLDDDPTWGPADLAPKLLGLYEQEILTLLTELRGTHRVLVNLGAGDGYYGVGLVAAGFFERSICFELSEKGRDAIRRVALKNGVIDRVNILGQAGPDFAKVVGDLGFKSNDCLILCDIEGAEFSIFSDQCLASLQGAHLIIELHGYMHANGNALEQSLISNSEQLFQVSTVKTSARDLSSIPELDIISDSDRWLICSEGRPKLMSWMILRPK